MTSSSKPLNSDWHDKPAPFLTQPMTLDETPLPRLLGFCVVLIACLMTAFIGWAMLAHVDEITTASGQITPSRYVQAVQNRDGGVVEAILVEEGQIVQKGQTLFRLDPTNANADLGQIKSRQNSLRLQAWRLKSFVAGNAIKTGSDALSSEERNILDSMILSSKSQKQVLLDQMAQKQKEHAALLTTQSALEKNMELTLEQAGMYNDMAAQGGRIADDGDQQRTRRQPAARPAGRG